MVRPHPDDQASDISNLWWPFLYKPQLLLSMVLCAPYSYIITPICMLYQVWTDVTPCQGGGTVTYLPNVCEFSVLIDEGLKLGPSGPHLTLR